MLTNITELLLIAVLPALLVGAAFWDLASFTIPNVLPAAMGACFVLFIAVAAMDGDVTWTALGLHVAAGLIALVAGMVMFAFGWVGGGDAKLYAVASLWLGWNMLLEYTLIASILGGGLTLGILALRKVPLPAVLHGQGWLLKLADKDSGIPYGIALSAAALAALPQSELFRIAAGG